MLDRKEREWFEPWVSTSHRFGTLAFYYITEIQYLGRMELELRRREAAVSESVRSGYEPGHMSLEAANLYPFSAAWVMMGYEVLRSLVDDFWNRWPAFREPTLKHPLKHAKRQFAQLRIPLAKHKAAKTAPDTSDHAELGIQLPKSVGWFLSADKFVTRAHMADLFIDALTRGSSEVPQVIGIQAAGQSQS